MIQLIGSIYRGLAVYLVSDKVTPSFISSTLGASSIVALYLTVRVAPSPCPPPYHD